MKDCVPSTSTTKVLRYGNYNTSQTPHARSSLWLLRYYSYLVLLSHSWICNRRGIYCFSPSRLVSSRFSLSLWLSRSSDQILRICFFGFAFRGLGLVRPEVTTTISFTSGMTICPSCYFQVDSIIEILKHCTSQMYQPLLKCFRRLVRHLEDKLTSFQQSAPWRNSPHTYSTYCTYCTYILHMVQY